MLQSMLDRLDQGLRSEGLFEQHVAAGFVFEPGDVRIAGTKQGLEVWPCTPRETHRFRSR